MNAPIPRQASRACQALPSPRPWRCTLVPIIAVALGSLLMAGCAAPSHELGRIERLPEGTLPPGKEVGPPVNIQPAPLPRPLPPPRYPYRVPRGYGPWGSGVYGPGFGPCLDPVFCAPGAIGGGAWVGPLGPGFGLGIRVR